MEGLNTHFIKACLSARNLACDNTAVQIGLYPLWIRGKDFCEISAFH